MTSTDIMPSGLPRPLAKDDSGKLRPVPWSQKGSPEDARWGELDMRVYHCTALSQCLVCGEVVDEGFVLWSRWDTGAEDNLFEPPELIAQRGLTGGRIMDAGPLHDRCVLITRSHCRHVRENLHTGRFVLVPYKQA